MPHTGVVTKRYRQPYANPIHVHAGERVEPDFARHTDLAGWVWCTDARGRGGWTPQEWLERRGSRWHVIRDFDAIELTVAPGDPVTLHFEHAGFWWVTTTDGRTGWVPSDHIRADPD